MVKTHYLSGHLSQCGLYLYYAASWFAALSILIIFTLTDFYTMRPIDISGTLFGGQMGYMLKISLLHTALSGFVLLGLFRLSGWRIAWIIAGLLQIGIAVYWRVCYWNEYGDPQVILSPESGDLYLSMLIGAGMAAFGAIKYIKARRIYRSTRPDSFPFFRTLVALFLILIYAVWPIASYVHKPLPDCAYSPTGQQLTACLGADDERIIVE